jgi:catecholate siderophore receptor
MISSRFSTQLLAGTALSLVYSASVLAEADTQMAEANAQIPTITVEGQAVSDYKIDKSALGKITEPVRDVPQSISIISEQLIEDRGITNLNDVFRSVPGITLGAGEFNWQGNNPNIRGFNSRSDMFLDGMRDFGNYYRDPFILETVEVLQGPASMVFGRGSTGGVINQSTKQATLAPMITGALNFGTDSTKRVTADINEPLSDLGEGGAVRLVAMGHSGAVAGRDGGEQGRYGFAPSLVLGLGTPTRIHLSYFHLSSNDTPDYGLPWFGPQNVAQVPRNNFYGFKSDYLKTSVDVVTAKVDHDFSENLKLHTQLRYGHYDRDNRITEPQIAAAVGTPPANVTVNRNVYTGRGTETFLQAQTDLTAKFNTGSLKHNVVTGLEVGRERSTPFFGFAQGVPGTNLLTPDKNAIFVSTGTPPSLIADTTGNGFAIYAMDTLKITEKFQLIGGVRWDSFRVNYGADRYVATTGAYVSSERVINSDKEFSFRAGAVYKPVEEGSIYFGFGTSFNPSAETLTFVTVARGAFPVSNAFLDPEKNKNYEIGTKWDWMGGKLSTTVAVFRIVKENARIPDPSTPGFNALGGTLRSQGIELGITGHLTERWQIMAGYVYLDGEVTKAPVGATPVLRVGTPLAFAPKNSFSYWTSYMVTPKIQLGTGGQYVDSRFAFFHNTGAAFRGVPGYWTFDAMAKYVWSEHLSFKVNLTNLTDKYYYDALHPQHVIPGAGRTAMFAINITY